ncbi:MAG: hypothetical protein PVF89_06160 [Lysobacterales bacterium]|jgi:hypothetical protein
MHEQAAKQLSEDTTLQALLGDIRRRHGETLAAVLVYGSWLRGARDTVLDFYALVDTYQSLDTRWQGLMCRLLPPNVYQIHQQIGDREVRAKYALLTLKRFHRAVLHDFHSYFWARFAQPCAIVYTRDASVEAGLLEAFSLAAANFVRHVVPTLPGHFSSEALWVQGLGLTYHCELRTESGQRPATIYASNSAYYDRVTRTLAAQGMTRMAATEEGEYRNLSSVSARAFARAAWRLRSLQGKVLSLLRLLKAAYTFNDGLDYLLWKIKRHSGVYIEPTARQRKHPLIFAWPLLWRLYRQGAFR